MPTQRWSNAKAFLTHIKSTHKNLHKTAFYTSVVNMINGLLKNQNGLIALISLLSSVHWGRLKCEKWKMWKKEMQHKIAGVENAGKENVRKRPNADRKFVICHKPALGLIDLLGANNHDTALVLSQCKDRRLVISIFRSFICVIVMCFYFYFVRFTCLLTALMRQVSAIGSVRLSVRPRVSTLHSGSQFVLLSRNEYCALQQLCLLTVNLRCASSCWCACIKRLQIKPNDDSLLLCYLVLCLFVLCFYCILYCTFVNF